MDIYREFTIEAAHLLPHVPDGHKCKRLHGHSFRIEVHVGDDIDPELGWVMDFAQIKDSFEPVFRQLDHRYLNDIEGLENPTSENLARWVWQKLLPRLPQLKKIIIKETCNSGCVYRGE